MTKADFAKMIAGRVFLGELIAGRMLGIPALEAIELAFSAHDETYGRVFEEDRPAVATRFRPYLAYTR